MEPLLHDLPIEQLAVKALRVPTNRPEADGTLRWNHTTMVLVTVQSAGVTGLGYTYSHPSIAGLIRDSLRPLVHGQPAMALEAVWDRLRRQIRNLGPGGLASQAVSAVDAALWDLKARLLGVPLALLLGGCRQAALVYGSGGFTSYPLEVLRDQLAGWTHEHGISQVKMKIGLGPAEDLARVAVAREAIGPEIALMVDANGAYDRKQALALAQGLAEYGVCWFEEPVSSEDLEGLRLLRDRVPPEMTVAAGEYGYDPVYFRRMLEAGAVDVLQVDVTRCLGITGFARVVHLAEGYGIRVSPHTAPAQHASLACALANIAPLEYFHDHARIEQMLFEHVPPLVEGTLRFDPRTAGNGLTLNAMAAAPYEVDAQGRRVNPA